MIYAAYGTNLCIKRMKSICPNALFLESKIINDWKLVFNKFPNIIPEEGYTCGIGLWKITLECEKNLDKWEEGYFKDYITDEKFLIYRMKKSGLSLPNKKVLNYVKKGFEDFNLPTELLTEALKASIKED